MIGTDRGGDACAPLRHAARDRLGDCHCLSPAGRTVIGDGFGASSIGEDAFDAALGPSAMLKLVARRRPEKMESINPVSIWKEWILGR